MIRNVEMERFTVISSKPFDQVLAAINDAIGHPDMTEFWRSTHRARSIAELESTIEKAVGKAGLMLFSEFDHGAIVRKETGRDTPRMIRFVIGNPLIMKKWLSMFQTRALMRRLRSLLMSAPMVCICHMTGWPAFWLLTKTSMRSR